METLFQKYGGIKTISQLVHDFYDDVTADDILAPLFEGVVMGHLVEHQISFLSHALGGPVSYDGRDLQDAHRHLPITNAHFERVAEILRTNLLDHGVEDGDVSAIMELIASTMPDIVSR